MVVPPQAELLLLLLLVVHGVTGRDARSAVVMMISSIITTIKIKILSSRRTTAEDRLKNVDGELLFSCSMKMSALQNATTTTATSSRREDDLLCAFACAQHIHTHTHAQAHTRTRKHTTDRPGRLCKVNAQRRQHHKKRRSHGHTRSQKTCRQKNRTNSTGNVRKIYTLNKKKRKFKNSVRSKKS